MMSYEKMGKLLDEWAERNDIAEDADAELLEIIFEYTLPAPLDADGFVIKPGDVMYTEHGKRLDGVDVMYGSPTAKDDISVFQRADDDDRWLGAGWFYRPDTLIHGIEVE